MSQIFSPDSTRQVNDGRNGAPCRKSYETFEDDDAGTDEQHHTTTTTTNKPEIINRVMKNSGWNIRTDCENKRADFRKICSICLVDSQQLKCPRFGGGGGGRLIKPCLCNDARSYQHERCIEEWIEMTGSATCPFCNVRYEYTRKKKSFWEYISHNELEYDFLIGLLAFLFSLYLFLVGMTVCYYYMFSVYTCDQKLTVNMNDVSRLLLFGDSSVLDKLVDCHRSQRDFEKAHSWPSIILFCFVCVSTVLLFIGIISTGLNLVFRQYVKYLLWTRSNFRVMIKPYRLDGLTSAIITDGLGANIE